MAATWQTGQPIEKWTVWITHCLVYKAPSNQFDSLCPPSELAYFIGFSELAGCYGFVQTELSFCEA